MHGLQTMKRLNDEQAERELVVEDKGPPDIVYTLEEPMGDTYACRYASTSLATLAVFARLDGLEKLSVFKYEGGKYDSCPMTVRELIESY